MSKMTIESFNLQASKLRLAADRADHTFMMFLVECEALDFWRETCNLYEKFLEQNDHIKATRYLSYKRALTILGKKAVLSVGVHGAILAAEAKERAEQQDILDEVRAHERTNGGRPISQQTAKRIKDVRRAVSLGATRGQVSYRATANRVDRLEKENEDLRTENAALRAEIKVLKTENKALKRETT